MRLVAIALVAVLATGAPAADRAPRPDPRTTTYELRTYYPAPGKMEALRARFRDHTLKLFRKHGMVNVAYWNAEPTADAPDGRLIYVLAYPSRQARDADWAAFRADPEWQTVAAASERDGKLTTRTESVFMTLADFSPALRFGR